MMQWFRTLFGGEDPAATERRTRSRQTTEEIVRLTEELYLRDKKLQESLRRMEGMLESQSDCIIRICPATRRLTYANRVHMETFYGPDDKDFSDKQVGHRIHPEDMDAFMTGWGTVLSQRPYRSTIEIRCRTFQHGYRWYRWECAAVFGDENEIVEIQCVGRDVTDRRLAEQGLHDANEMLRGTLDSPTSLVVRFDADRRLVYANSAYAKTFGECVRETGFDFYSLIHPDDIAESAGYHAKMWGPPYRAKHQQRARTVDGAYRCFEWEGWGVFDSAGKFLGVAAYGRDITDRIKQAKKLARQTAMTVSANAILLKLAHDAELQDILDAVCLHCEQHDEGIKASVLLYDKNKKMLLHAAGPSLPEEYNDLLKPGLPIGEGIGTCGSAAATMALSVAQHIQSHPNWLPYGKFVSITQKHGIHACWSLPITSSKEELLGTIANYRTAPGPPHHRNLVALEWAAMIAGIAIEQTNRRESLMCLWDHASIYFWQIPSPDTMGECNPALAAFFGTTSEALTGAPLESLMSPAEYEICLANNLRVFAGDVVQTEEWVTRHDGRSRLWRIMKTPVFKAGVVHHAMACAMDITEMCDDVIRMDRRKERANAVEQGRRKSDGRNEIRGEEQAELAGCGTDGIGCTE